MRHVGEHSDGLGGIGSDDVCLEMRMSIVVVTTAKEDLIE